MTSFKHLIILDNVGHLVFDQEGLGSWREEKGQRYRGWTHEAEQVPHLMQLLMTRFNAGALGFQIEEVGVQVYESDWL